MKLKKIVSAALAFLMLSGCIMIGSASAADDEGLPFKDVGKKKWFYDAVKYVYDGGLMNGTTADKFEPNANLSRAMFITILGRLAGAETKESDVFPDIKKNSWYSGYVGWAVEAGVVKGYDDGTFKPNKSLSRQEMAVAVDRFLNYLGCRTTTNGGIFYFKDEKKVASWAKNSLDILRVAEVINGDQNGNFNPKNNITRAEAATIIMNLQQAINNAWQGYLPEDGVSPIILGASYLYWNGTACTGEMLFDLGKSGDYPVIEAYMDPNYAMMHESYIPNKQTANTVGVSISQLDIDIAKTPFVKIAYSYDGMDETPLTAYYRVKTADIWVYPEVINGENDGNMKTATLDLKDAVAAVNGRDLYSDVENLFFRPCAEDYSGDGRFIISYIGFFETKAEADAFTAESNTDINDYLKNYTDTSSANINEYTEEVANEYNKLLADRIAEIKNAKSAVTPEDIKANGGNVYYVSSINGNDSNDGKTPETAWKTTEALWHIKANRIVWTTKFNPGDGVFFERGSVFYPSHQYNFPTTYSTLVTTDGVTYGAYGEGEQPLFKCSLDFTDQNGTGTWYESGYKNVWVIDMPDDYVNEVGNIYFDGGRAIGIRVIAPSSDVDKQVFAEGSVSHKKDYVCTGLEYYYSEERPMDNPGTALLHNLEFFFNAGENKVYLYWDKGNPADSFETIDIPRDGSVAWVANNVRFDNLALRYSSVHTARWLDPNGKLECAENIKMTNCEIGFAGGALSSMESGFEIFGACDGLYIDNCYVHDVGDGPLSVQFVPENGIAEDISWTNNVIVSSGNGTELLLEITNKHPDVEMGLLVEGNLFAYIGYGITQNQATGFHGKGLGICQGASPTFEDGVYRNNIYMHCNGGMIGTFISNYQQRRGFIMDDNTYIGNTVNASLFFHYEPIFRDNTSMNKHTRVYIPFTERIIAWTTRNGIDSNGKYYFYDELNEHEAKGAFFMTGYWAERGGFELK